MERLSLSLVASFIEPAGLGGGPPAPRSGAGGGGGGGRIFKGSGRPCVAFLGLFFARRRGGLAQSSLDVIVLTDTLWQSKGS